MVFQQILSYPYKKINTKSQVILKTSSVKLCIISYFQYSLVINQIFNVSFKYNLITITMNPKKKIEPVSYGITKSEANYQINMIELMNRLIDQTKVNNVLLERFIEHAEGKQAHSQQSYQSRNALGTRIHQTGYLFYPPTSKNHAFRKLQPIHGQRQNKQSEQRQRNMDNSPRIEHEEENVEYQQDEFKKFLQTFQQSFLQITKTNKNIYEALKDLNQNNKIKTENSEAPKDVDKIVNQKIVENNQRYEQVVIDLITKKQKLEKKTFGHYGILSEIMPFSDKREMKVRYKIIDLMEAKQLSQNLNMEQFKQKTTEWVGMVFRATASICWNMLYGGQLNFQQVKVLFTENIIFNFIEFMKDIIYFTNQQKRLQLTNHINYISCEVLEFLCKQYPQTKVEAPNIALRKSIPNIENQGQCKFDLVTMVCRDNTAYKQDDQSIVFSIREDKDYSSLVMKVINYMIDHTEDQFQHFQKTMTNIFEKIFLPKQKRKDMKGYEPINLANQNIDSQYRQKVKTYSSYLIGRKIPKNTPKYTKDEIQYGVFFVKSPSILRIITKWFEQLWEFANTSFQKLKLSTNQIKDHTGRVLNISTRVKHLLYENINARLNKIQDNIQRLRNECYNMELFLSEKAYTMDSKLFHLSEDQLSVGKYCSNLKDAISSYVCAQLSKIIYYLLLIPQEIDEKVLEFNDEDFQQQARKHLDNTNLVTLKIFDLLRCKCHSNQQEIIYIVEALKRFEREDSKFQIVRVKDRLNQGTRDILINAQYDGGLVWEIQLAVTSNIDKKQDLLDKYNHFLYELKRTKLGPISECVSIWSSLEQRSLYFQQLIQKRKDKASKCQIVHNKKTCKQSQASFPQFKRPIICQGCKEYHAIPATSLLNVRCETCKITYCGLCFYASLSDIEKKQFMFQNFKKKKLMNSAAFNQLQQYTDISKPLPKQGFFIKKKFLNRQLSYFTITKIQKIANTQNQYLAAISQSIIRKGQVHIRSVNKTDIYILDKDGQYYLKPSCKSAFYSTPMWTFYFKNRKSERINLKQLQQELRDDSKGKTKYLNVIFQPNYMNELKLYSKIFEKVRLINNFKSTLGIQKYSISIYRFSHLTILAKIEIEQAQLNGMLIKKSNKLTLKGFAQKKMTIINMEQYNLSNEVETFIDSYSQQLSLYFTKIQKLYLADNNIENIICFKRFSNLESLSISKNYLKSLSGIQALTKLYYLKFDQNNISSLLQVKNLINLTYISGNINDIVSLTGLQTLQNLGSLSFCQNKIQDITPLKRLSNLKRLYLRDNPIKTIMPIEYIRIKHLYIGNTLINPMQLARIDCCQILQELSLKNMRLAAIPKIFDRAEKLQELKLSKNQIKKIQNLQKAINLLRLDLNDNQITVMQNLQTLQSLQVLSVKNNQIKVVQRVKNYIQSLKVLHLQNNPLDDVSDYLAYEDKSTLFMRLKFTQQAITAKAKEQIRNHALQIGNKSESDD